MSGSHGRIRKLELPLWLPALVLAYERPGSRCGADGLAIILVLSGRRHPCRSLRSSLRFGRFLGARNSSSRRCCLKTWPEKNCRRCSRKDRFIRSTHQSTPPVLRLNWPNFWFIRFLRIKACQRMDMLVPSGVVSTFPMGGFQHVHQFVVPRVCHSRLPACGH